MTFRVQWMNAAMMWVTMMDNILCENQAIRYAQHRAASLSGSVRVITNSGSVVQYC